MSLFQLSWHSLVGEMLLVDGTNESSSSSEIYGCSQHGEVEGVQIITLRMNSGCSDYYSP